MTLVQAAFQKQIGWCESLGSPLTAQVLAAVLAELDDGGPFAALLAGWPGNPVADALPLRVAGALHALALRDAAPELTAVYPPHALPEPSRLRSILVQVLEAHRAFIAAFLASPPQTNEVGRSAVLLGGFLQIVAETGLPLRLLEIGASAGLNTNWDRYGYRLGARTWGDPASPVQLAPDWTGPLPRLDAAVHVLSRRACDVAPIDLEDSAQRLHLKSYVWADQRDRLERLDGAIAFSRASGTKVERAEASAWVRDRLREPAPGCVRVLYHSIMWRYMPLAARGAILADLDRAGRDATPDAPLAWVRFEPSPDDRPRPDLRLTLWPSGGKRYLAEAHAHGSSVTWLGG